LCIDTDPDEADLCCDLNQELPWQLKGEFSLVVDCGTTEHIFDVKQTIENINSLCRDGGKIFHHTPANGYIDHGFFQFSPTFYLDYYGDNIISAYTIKDYGKWVVAVPYTEDIYRTKGWKFAAMYPRATNFFLAKKTDKNTPHQGYYSESKKIPTKETKRVFFNGILRKIVNFAVINN